jgi:hypothetical protein
MGYNLKRDGWLNSFTDSKNQYVKVDGVPWRGAREKRPEFFSILFSALTEGKVSMRAESGEQRAESEERRAEN